MQLAQEDRSWWGRPAGGREVAQVAAPLVISSLSWTVMTFVDRVMLSHVSGPAMTGAFSASTVWFLLVCFPLGICTYANTFVSQYFGAGRLERIGPAAWQAVWLALALGPLYLLAIPLGGPLFLAVGHSPEVVAHEVTYFQVLCVGAPGMLIAQAAASFFSGRGQTRVVMYTDSAFAGLNVLLDYAWIFGHWGFPEWGVAGAGWATVVSLWLKAGCYIVLLLTRRNRERFGTLRGMRIEWPLMGRLLWYGAPSGLQMLLDMAGFTAFILLVGKIGVAESEATSVAFSVSSVAFMPVWGLSLAVGILVGQRLGEDRDDLAARATLTSLVLGLGYMSIISLLYVFTPAMFLSGFGGPSDSPESTSRLAAVLLRFVAAYNLLDATAMVFAAAIKGAGDTGFVLRVSVVLAALLVGLSWLSVEYWKLGVYGSWSLITVWVWIVAIAYVLRYRQGAWRSMRVIEPPPPDLALAAE